MTFTRGHAKTGGRKRGARNRRTLAAAAKPNALDHLVTVMTSTDPTITPDLKLRAAIALAQYQHCRPISVKVDKPIDLKPPQSAQEARDAIARITDMIAKGEIDSEHGSRVIMQPPRPISAPMRPGCR